MQRKRLRCKGASLPPLEVGQELSVPKSVLKIVAKFSHSFCKRLHLHTSRGQQTLPRHVRTQSETVRRSFGAWWAAGRSVHAPSNCVEWMKILIKLLPNVDSWSLVNGGWLMSWWQNRLGYLKLAQKIVCSVFYVEMPNISGFQRLCIVLLTVSNLFFYVENCKY